MPIRLPRFLASEREIFLVTGGQILKAFRAEERRFKRMLNDEEGMHVW